MKKLYFTVLCIVLSVYSFSQQPYIGTNGADGLGQYGYLEKDAVTFSRLFRNSYDNIAYLSARWWITDNSSVTGDGKEFVYHVYAGPDWDPLIGWQCGGDNDGSKRTTDFIASDFSPEWSAGADCYVSVCAKYCDDSYSPSSFDGFSTYGAVGFNERHFRVINIDTALHISTATNIPDGNGSCETVNAYHVAGSFAIDVANFNGLTLTTLFIKNDGSAVEVTDIPNAAFSVYYEAVTGSEIYGDGNETFAGNLTGDWDANTTDNVFGNTALNVPLSGKIRVYILLCDFVDGAVDRTINLSIINDGISLSPALDSYAKLRIDKKSISQKLITLPVKFIGFSGSRNRELVYLDWNIAVGNADEFIIQQSIDGRHFDNAKTVAVQNTQQRNYQTQLSSAAEFFKILVKKNGRLTASSNILHLLNKPVQLITLMENPIHHMITLQNPATITSRYAIQLHDAAGRLLLNKIIPLTPGINRIPIAGISAAQMLLLKLTDNSNHQYNFKMIQQ